MGLALGALGVLSFNNNNGVPYFLSPYYTFFGHPNFKSLLSLIVLTILICVVAYLTNPSEASFRTFLTELSFRHHLTRLNAQSNIPSTDPGCNAHDSTPDNGIVELGNQFHPLGIGLGISTRKSDTPSSQNRSGSNPSTHVHNAVDHHCYSSITGSGGVGCGERRFQFSSKASVSLRTPTHVYRSFGLITIAVVSPLTSVPPMTNAGLLGTAGSAVSHVDHHSAQTTNGITNSSYPCNETISSTHPPPIAGTWYIGIFGTWFTGGRVVQRRSSPHSSTLSTSLSTSTGSSSSTGIGKKQRSRASRITANISETVANFAMGSSGANVGGTTTLSLRSRKGEEVGVIVPSRGTRFGLIKFEGDDDECVDGLGRNVLSPPKTLRNRSISRSNIHQHAQSHGSRQQVKNEPPYPQRSSSPPPLPRSASLPLHSKSKGAINASIPTVAVNAPDDPDPSESQQQTHLLQQTTSHRPLSRVSSSSSLLESSPLISDLMAQLSASQSGVADLRSQLAAFEASAASAKGILENEVQVQRVKKRSEDNVRMELRTRIKALEEERRSAEGVKREKEKNLSHTLSRKRDVEKRLEKLLGEISNFKSVIEGNTRKMELSKEETDLTAEEYEEKIEVAKKEIEVAEKVLGQLNERAKDMEGQIAEQKGKITGYQERKPQLQVPARPQSKRIVNDDLAHTPWYPHSTPSTQQSSPLAEHASPIPVKVLEKEEVKGSRPRPLSLGGISNIITLRTIEPPVHASTLPLPVQNSGATFYGRFSPFEPVQDPSLPSPSTALISPLSPGASMSLIPSGIMDTPITLESEGLFGPPPVDSPKDPDDRGALARQSPEPLIPELKLSRASNSPEQVSPVPAYQQRYEMFDSQRAVIKPPSRDTSSSTEFSTEPFPLSSDDHSDTVSTKSRRWFSKEKNEAKEGEVLQKGLNPDAKIFKLTRKSPFLSLGNTNANGEGNNRLLDQAPGPIDPLNPSGPPSMPPHAIPRTSFFSSLRAFQPSPAEREALRFAMVSSANSSLERIGSSVSHHNGSSYSPPTTSPTPSLMNNPYLGSPGSVPRTSASQLLQGQGSSNTAGGFGGRNPWVMSTSSNHTPSHSLDALAAATVQAVNGEGESLDETPFNSASSHKKSFSFNPWGGDKLLGSK